MAIGTDTMTVTTGDNSDAALGTLFVSSNVYRNDDWMLHMFCQYIQQTTFQLNIHVVMTNEKNPADVLYLVIGGSGSGSGTDGGRGSDRKGPPEPTANVIRERNAIVRSLMGIALHGSFDTYYNYTNHQLLSTNTNTNTNTSSNTSSNTNSKTPFTPICWNGGYSMMQTSCHSTSIVAALQHVKMIHYMTVASQLRIHKSNMMMLLPVFSMTLQELDQTLQNTSFLLPYSATASFADMDVAVSLLLAFLSSSSSMTTTNLETSDLLSMYHNTFPVNVQRWMVQMIPTIQQLSTITNVPCPYHPNMIQLMDAIVSLANAKSSSCPIIFFYGTEDTKQVLAQLRVKTSAPRSVGAKQPSKSIPKLSATTDDKTETGISNDAATTAAAGGVNDGGKKKLTKQDKKAAAVAAKAASGGGDTSADAAATGNTKKVEATTAAPASDVYDVTALDLRIGKIIKIWEHESADKLYCEEIDFGNGEIRQIASGLRPFYKDPNELLNQLVLVVYNLKKRTLVGFPSHGMVLCASNADHTAVEIVTPPPNATLGERIVFHGLDQTKVAEPESKVAKKKIFESIAPDLVTNEEGYVQWKTHAAQCSIGPIRAVNGMSNAHVS